MKVATAQLECHSEPQPADFSRLAHFYRWMEWLSFGPFLWRCRCSFLAEMRLKGRALVIGDGDGRFTARLFDQNPAVRVDAVDASPGMLQELRRRSRSHDSRLKTYFADARSYHPPSPDYDLVVTHFFLDCLTTGEVDRLARRLRSKTAEDASWVISEFAVPKGCYGQAVARPLIGLLYRVFGWLTGLPVRRLPDYRAALHNAGWTLARERRWLGGLLVSEIWTAR